MLIRHSDKASDPQAAKESGAEKPDGKKIALRERDVAELKHFVRDQIEKYRLDRERLEKELVESRRDVEALTEEVERFRKLLQENNVSTVPTPSARPSKEEDQSITPPPASSLRRHVDADRERYSVKGARAAGTPDESDDAVLPPIEPARKKTHLSTTELLFVRAVDAEDEVPPDQTNGSLRLAILTVVIVCLSFGLMYWEQISNLVAWMLGNRAGR